MLARQAFRAAQPLKAVGQPSPIALVDNGRRPDPRLSPTFLTTIYTDVSRIVGLPLLRHRELPWS